jgi:hypothetical protein
MSDDRWQQVSTLYHAALARAEGERGQRVVFDRVRENSDVVLIEIPAVPGG